MSADFYTEEKMVSRVEHVERGSSEFLVEEHE